MLAPAAAATLLPLAVGLAVATAPRYAADIAVAATVLPLVADTALGGTAHLADTLEAVAAVIAPRPAVVDITAAVAADTSVAGTPLPRPRALPRTTNIREQQGS